MWSICEPLVNQPITACIERNPKFEGMDLADCSDGSAALHIDVLIGSDYYWDLVTGSICKGDGGLTAIHTKLGWVLSGPVSTRGPVQCSMNLSTTHVLTAAQPLETAGLDAQLRSFWELESRGIYTRGGEDSLLQFFQQCHVSRRPVQGFTPMEGILRISTRQLPPDPQEAKRSAQSEPRYTEAI